MNSAKLSVTSAQVILIKRSIIVTIFESYSIVSLFRHWPAVHPCVGLWHPIGRDPGDSALAGSARKGQEVMMDEKTFSKVCKSWILLSILKVYINWWCEEWWSTKVYFQFQVRYVGGSNMTGWQLQLAACLSKKEGMAKYSVLQQQWVGFYSICWMITRNLFKVQPAVQRAWMGSFRGCCQGGGWHPSLESPQGQISWSPPEKVSIASLISSAFLGISWFRDHHLVPAWVLKTSGLARIWDLFALGGLKALCRVVGWAARCLGRSERPRKEAGCNSRSSFSSSLLLTLQ